MQKFKKFLLISLSLFFGLGIVAFSAFRVGQAEVMAQNGEEEEVEVIEISKEEEEEEEEEMEEEEGEEEELVVVEGEEEVISPEKRRQLEIAGEEPRGGFKEIDYYLAYPGILPDHPLYWLKMIRDKIILSFTNKSLPRFERLLLYADKRVGAAKALIEGGKAELGVTTADKAEKYLEQTVSQFENLAKSGEATPELNNRLSKALLKHQEILMALLDRVPDQSKATLNQAIEKTEQNYQKIKSQFD